MTDPMVTLVDDLRAVVRGPVLVPGDDGYATEIAVPNLAVVHHVDVAVGVADAADVGAAVRVAAAHGATVRVQATGHGAEEPIVGGVLLVTRRLSDLVIDPGARVATIGAGVSWGAVVDAAAAHGLMPITGSAGTVGCVGLTSGGGLGPLSRSHGFASDYVVGLTLVDAQGSALEVSTTTHPDLLWAFRGGKTLTGIVTQLRVRLVGQRTLYAGSLMFQEPHIEQVLRGWVDWTAGAPDDVTTSVAIIGFPPIEQIPPPLRGQRLLNLRFAYPGDAVAGEAAAAPLRRLAPIYMDHLGAMPVAQTARIHNDPTDAAPAWLVGGLLDRLDQDAVSELLGRFGAGTRPPIMVTEVRHLGGATRHDVPEGSAVAGRGASWVLMLVAADPTRFDEAPKAAAACFDALRPWVSAEANPNFPVHDGVTTCTTPAGSTARERRLAEIRTRYDPNGVFG